MRLVNKSLLAVAVVVAALCAVSCAKKAPKQQQTPQTAAPAETTASKPKSYVSEEINFGMYFDEAGTKRTIKLSKGQKTLTAYLILKFPEGMRINAVEYRLSLPKGLEIDSEKAYPGIVAHLGRFEDGMSETFPCVNGPTLLLHTFTVMVTGELSNAEIMILPDPTPKFLGVTICEENNPAIPASSFKAIVNPTE